LIGFGYLNNCDYVVLSSREEADLPEMLKTVIPLFEPLEAPNQADCHAIKMSKWEPIQLAALSKST
jgi:hypothetical protein